MHRGHIKIWRKIDEWEWVDDPNTFCLFIHLNLMANWKDKKWHGKTIRRGELITTLDKLSKKTGLSIQNIRTSLKKLLLTQEVTKNQHSNYTHLSIKNYDKYQGDNTVSNKSLTNDQQLLKKEKKEKKEIEKYMSLNSITKKDVQEIARKYKVLPQDVAKKYEDLKFYCGSTGKKYKNYKLALMNWIRSDLEKGKIEGNIFLE